MEEKLKEFEKSLEIMEKEVKEMGAIIERLKQYIEKQK